RAMRANGPDAVGSLVSSETGAVVPATRSGSCRLLQDVLRGQRDMPAGRTPVRRLSPTPGQGEAGARKRRRHRADRGRTGGPPLERQRALVEEHRCTVQGGSTGSGGGGEERRGRPSVDQIDEQAAPGRRAEADRQRTSREPERGRVDDGPRGLERA